MEEEQESDSTGRNERRDSPRFAVDENASLLVLNHGSSVSAQIVELSMGGCRLRVPQGFRTNASMRVELTFKVNGIAFRLAGVLQWTDGRRTVGVRFNGMPERRRVELCELLGEIEAEAAAKAAKLVAEQRDATELETQKLVAEKLASEKQASEREERERAVQESRNHERLIREKAEREKLIREQSASARRKEQIEARREIGEQAAAAGSRVNAAKISSLRPMNTVGAVAATGEAKREALIQPANENVVPTAVAKPSQRERRAQARHSVDSQATIFLVDVAARTAGRILDVSMGGCRIRTDERFPVGIYRRVEAEFVLDGLPFRLGGVTQSLHDRRTVGIRFLDLSERKREQLMMLVEEIDEMQAEEKLRGPAGGRAQP